MKFPQHKCFEGFGKLLTKGFPKKIYDKQADTPFLADTYGIFSCRADRLDDRKYVPERIYLQELRCTCIGNIRNGRGICGRRNADHRIHRGAVG
jgi:hypothetical protein